MKADLVTAWLYNEGYKHEIDEDGDVHFRYNGKHIYFTPDEEPRESARGMQYDYP